MPYLAPCLHPTYIPTYLLLPCLHGGFLMGKYGWYRRLYAHRMVPVRYALPQQSLSKKRGLHMLRGCCMPYMLAPSIPSPPIFFSLLACRSPHCLRTVCIPMTCYWFAASLCLFYLPSFCCLFIILPGFLAVAHAAGTDAADRTRERRSGRLARHHAAPIWAKGFCSSTRFITSSLRRLVLALTAVHHKRRCAINTRPSFTRGGASRSGGE